MEKSAGYYQIPHNHGIKVVDFELQNKPPWLHRIISKWLLGWEWRDYQVSGTL